MTVFFDGVRCSAAVSVRRTSAVDCTKRYTLTCHYVSYKHMNTNIAEKRNNRKQVTVAKARHLETQSSLFIGQRKSMEKLRT